MVSDENICALFGCVANDLSACVLIDTNCWTNYEKHYNCKVVKSEKVEKQLFPIVSSAEQILKSKRRMRISYFTRIKFFLR